LKNHIQSESDKQKLAQYLGKSKITINSMLKTGQMGLDSWIGSFIYCYGLDVDKVAKYISELPMLTNQIKSDDPGDLLWKQLSEKLTSQEKIYYAHLLLLSHDANEKLAPSKKSRK
jgi:hypothetical protein